MNLNPGDGRDWFVDLVDAMLERPALAVVLVFCAALLFFESLVFLVPGML